MLYNTVMASPDAEEDRRKGVFSPAAVQCASYGVPAAKDLTQHIRILG